VFSYERGHPDGAVRVHLNFGGEARAVDPRLAGPVLLSTSGRAERGSGPLVLGPGEGVVVDVVP
jgi:hypothetical protein